MDISSKDKESPETKESTVNDSENVSFIWGTAEFVTPQKHGAEMTPNLCTPATFKSPLNFSTVTIEQLGITPESFVNSSGKSPSYFKKSRRLSTVGTRGSTETNHLIRFLARQRNLQDAEGAPLTQDSLFQGSPGLYQNVNSLRERISAFQSAFHPIKENEKMANCLEFSEAEGGSETTGLAKKQGLGECHQSGLPAKVSSKRRKISSESSSDDCLSNVQGKAMDLQVFRTDVDRAPVVDASARLPEESYEPGSTQSGGAVEESILLPEPKEASSGLEVVDCVEGTGSVDAVPLDLLTTKVSTDTVPSIRSPATPVSRRDIPSNENFVLRSVLKKPSGKLFPESLQEHHDNLCDDGTHQTLISNLSNCCKEQKAEDQGNCKTPSLLNVRKRKRVTFGEDLSPEVFDESLPANTPLRKGGTPVRQKDLSGISPLLLEQSPVLEQLLQPHFDDKGENLENIEPHQVSFAVLSPNKSSISETHSGTDNFSSSNNQEKIPSCKVGRLTRTSNRRKQLMGFAEENVCNSHNTEAQPCKEKKISRKKSQETKCTKRALPKKNQALKSCRKKKGKGKKSVQKSLYGERDIASKKPLLSPIPELPEDSEMTPSVPGVRKIRSDDFKSSGNLKHSKPPKTVVQRRNPSPQKPLFPGLDSCDVSELCCSHTDRSSLPGDATSEEEPNTSTKDPEDDKNIPKSEYKLESEEEPKTEIKNANSRICCVPGTEEHTASDNSKPGFIRQCQEFSAAGQNVEKPCQIFKIAEDNIRCEKEDHLFVATKKKPRCNHFMSHVSQFHCLEDVLVGNKKESTSHSEDVGRKSAEINSVMSCRGTKHRRCSTCYSDGQKLDLEQNRNHKPSYSAGSSLEIHVGNSELCKDLSDIIEQTFQRTNNEIKVRRSTRLQRHSAKEGLVWMSLPFSSTSQKTKRRTICTTDSRGFENMSPRKETVASQPKPAVSYSVSGRESCRSPAADSRLPGKRRSVCVSTLARSQSATQPPGCQREAFLQGKGGGAQLPSGGRDTAATRAATDTSR